MIEQLLAGADGENALNINCGSAYIFSDREGFLEKFEKISINCGKLLASSEAYANLAGKGASINSGKTTVREIRGEVMQLEHGAVITEEMDFTDKFIFSTGNAVIEGNGGNALAKAEGAHFEGTLFYPKECGGAFLPKVTGDTQAYPQDAMLVLDDKELEDLIHSVPEDKTHVWVHGEIKALAEKPLIKAKEKGLRLTCRSLLTMEALFEKYGDLFEAQERTLVPDGFEVTGDLRLTAGEAALYGPRIYVRGDLSMNKKDEGCLDTLEAIIVRGTATIPASCAKAFRAIGKADEYELVDDNMREIMKINGFQTIGHDLLQQTIAKGETMRIDVNGFLYLDESVTAQDMDAIDTMNVNGVVLIPDAAQGVLSAKTGEVNGAVLGIESLVKLTGMTLPEILAKLSSGSTTGTNINVGKYVLI